MRRWRLILLLLIAHGISVAGNLHAGESEGDLTAIRELLLTLERGYEEKDVEKYASVFSGEEYEYISDMATPDDPADDVYLLEAEDERRAAIRVFEAYEHIDLEITDPKIRIDGDLAEAGNDIEIILVKFEKPNVPEIYYAATSNIFSMKKTKGQWKIVGWQQYETSPKELAARKREERRDREAEELIRDLGNDDLETWTSAMVALGKKRDNSVGELIEALHNPLKNVRIRAAKVLYGTRDENAVKALIDILEDGREDMDTRVAAAAALSECDGQDVDRSLSRMARIGKPDLKSAAMMALAIRTRKKMDELQRIAVAGLQHEDEAVRKAAAECLGAAMSTRGADLLEQRFRNRNESDSLRLAALEALKQNGSRPVLDLFRDALKDRTEALPIRIHAARALAEAKDHQSLELMVHIAESEEEAFELRKEAISALTEMEGSKAVKPLTDLLSSSDAGLRRQAVRSLVSLEDHIALKSLKKVLMRKDEDASVRHLAGRGIVRIDRDTAFGPLVQIVKDATESAPVRRMAIMMLASYKDDRSISLFVEVLKDEQQPWWLRRVAANHLGGFLRDSAPCVEALRAAATDADERIAKIARDRLAKNMDSDVTVSP